MTHHRYHGHLCDHEWAYHWTAEEQYMHCHKCGKQNPLGLFQHVDFDRDGPAVKWKPIPGRTGGILGDKHFPPGLSRVGTIKRSSYPGFFQRGGIIRTCIVYKKTNIPDILARSFWQGIPWRWSCRKCPATGAVPTWKAAYENADHHARNHWKGQL